MITYFKAVEKPELLLEIEDGTVLLGLLQECVKRIDDLKDHIPPRSVRQLDDLARLSEVPPAVLPEFRDMLRGIFEEIQKASAFERDKTSTGALPPGNMKRFENAMGGALVVPGPTPDWKSFKEFVAYTKVAGTNLNTSVHLKHAYQRIVADDILRQKIQEGLLMPDWEQIAKGDMKSLSKSPTEIAAIRAHLQNLQATSPRDATTLRMGRGSRTEGPKYRGMGSGPGYDRGDILTVNDSTSTTVRDMVNAAFQYIIAQEAIVYVFTDLPKSNFKATPKAIFELIGPDEWKNIPTWAWDHGNLLFLGKRGLTPGVRERLRKSASRVATERYPKVTILLSGQESSALTEEQLESLRSAVRGEGSTGGSLSNEELAANTFPPYE